MRRRTTLGDRNLVGGNIIRIRAEKKMSQGGFLSQIQLMGIDMNQAKLSRIEGKRIAITDRDLIAIAKCLGVTLDELCKQDNDTNEC